MVSNRQKLFNNFCECIDWIVKNKISEQLLILHKINFDSCSLELGSEKKFEYIQCGDTKYYIDSSRIENGYNILRDIPIGYQYAFVFNWEYIKNNLSAFIENQNNLLDNFLV